MLNTLRVIKVHEVNKTTLVRDFLLEMLLTEEATTVSSTGASGKTKTTTIKTTSEGGTEGTPGGSGTATNSTSGWQSEEGL